MMKNLKQDILFSENNEIPFAEKEIKSRIGLHTVFFKNISFNEEKSVLVLPFVGPTISRFENFRLKIGKGLFGFPWFGFNVKYFETRKELIINNASSFVIDQYYKNEGFGLFTRIIIKPDEIIFDSFEDDYKHEYMIKV